MTVTHSWTLPADTTAAAAGRDFVRSALAEYGNSSDSSDTANAADAEVAAAVTSELCTNAILHGSPPQSLKFVIDRDHLRIEVSNSNRVGGTVPKLANMPINSDDVGGRGLNLVNVLSSTWGAEVNSGSTTVWANICRT
jgi:anti-sigma regulatory factor (Ser/Thr protein kinase)